MFTGNVLRQVPVTHAVSNRAPPPSVLPLPASCSSSRTPVPSASFHICRATLSSYWRSLCFH